MKKDFFHTLLERSRRGGKYNRKGRHTKWADSPSKQSMKADKTDRKSLNENLRPLERYLESCVGRSWDKVYSDISKNLNSNSAVQLHVLQHVPDFVELHPEYNAEEKKYYYTRRYWRRGMEVEGLYVDVKGILRFNKKTPRSSWKRNITPEMRMVDDFNRFFTKNKCEYVVIDNVLYRQFTDKLDIKSNHKGTIKNADIDYFNQMRNGFYLNSKYFFRDLAEVLQKHAVTINKLDNAEYFGRMWDHLVKER